MLKTALLAVVAMTAAAGAAPADRHHGNEWTWSETFSSGKGRLGIQIFGINDELRAFYGAPAGKGILVGHVESGTPAAKAGVHVGDIVVAIAGKDVADVRDVMRALGEHKKGEAVALTVVRDKRPLVMSATLDSDPGPMVEPPQLDEHMFRDFDRDMQKQLDEMNERLRQLEQQQHKPSGTTRT